MTAELNTPAQIDATLKFLECKHAVKTIEGFISLHKTGLSTAEETLQNIRDYVNAGVNTWQPIETAVALTDVLKRVRVRADSAYSGYVGQLRRDECLGWEIKVERGKFGENELKAHCAAAETLGRHRALGEVANMLAEVLEANAQFRSREQ